MIVIWRAWYFAGLAGIALVVWGSVETKHAMASGERPVDVTVDALQNGEPVAQPYVRVGEHVALYGDAVGWGKQKTDQLDWTIYPIVPRDHPYLAAWDELFARYPNPDDIPEAECPHLEGAHVFVLTKRWRRTDDLPGGSELVDSVEGLLFPYADLDHDETRVLRALQPDLDRGRVRLLEHGRRPRPAWLCWTLGGIGAVLVAVAVHLFRRTHAAEKLARQQAREQAATPDPPAAGDA